MTCIKLTRCQLQLQFERSLIVCSCSVVQGSGLSSQLTLRRATEPKLNDFLMSLTLHLSYIRLERSLMTKQKNR